MALQHGLDVLHVGLGLVVLGLQVVQLIALLFEEAQNALLLLLIGIKALQLPDEVGDHIAHLAQILGGHLGQSSLGEIADLLLAGGAILQHLLAVGDIDLFRKGSTIACSSGVSCTSGCWAAGAGSGFFSSAASGVGSSVRVGTAGASRSKFKVLLSAIVDSILSNYDSACRLSACAIF